jgi:hypothetical protein
MTQTRSALVFDATGIEIQPLSIVGMSDRSGQWSPHRGLVVEPNSTIENDGYCVAVYFYREVGSTRFWNRDRRRTMPIEAWDARYGKNDAMSETSFLLKDDAWKKSPRVVFFKPRELIVQPTWDIAVLAERMFKNYHHSVFRLSEGLPQDPKAYMCWIKECQNPATSIALYNFWGSVYPFFVCEQCRSKVNGMCGECLPDAKNPHRTPDGSPIDPLVAMKR